MRPTADLNGREICKRYSYNELPLYFKNEIKRTDHLDEPCFIIYNNIVFDLDIMTEAPPERIPEGWDGRKGDVIFRLSDHEDHVEVGRIQR